MKKLLKKIALAYNVVNGGPDHFATAVKNSDGLGILIRNGKDVVMFEFEPHPETKGLAMIEAGHGTMLGGIMHDISVIQDVIDMLSNEMTTYDEHYGGDNVGPQNYGVPL